MSTAHTITDHQKIQEWVEERDGRPSRVVHGEEDGILRIDFADKDEELEEISWEKFFRIFEKNNLAFLCQTETDDGRMSRFNKFVQRT